MWFGLETTVACGIILSGLAFACRSESPETGRRSLTPPPPAPPIALTRAIADADSAALASLAAGPGREIVEGSCVICHSAAMIEQQHKDSAGWAKTAGQMRAWGAPVQQEQMPVLIAYLTKHYGVTRR
jgi:cytochrome c5